MSTRNRQVNAPEFRGGGSTKQDESSRWRTLVTRLALLLAVPLAVAPMALPEAALSLPGAPWFPLALLGLALVRLAAGSVGVNRARWRRPGELALLGGWLTYAIAVGVGRPGTASDNLPTRDLPGRLLDGRGLDFSDTLRHLDEVPYWLIRAPGGVLPAFPLGTAGTWLPYVAAARAVAGPFGATPPPERQEKHAAALLGAATAALLAAALRRRFPAGAAAGATAAFALASPQLSSSAQGLWSHTGALFWFAVAFWLLAGRASARRGAGAGLALAAAFACRPQVLLLAPLLLVLGRSRRALAWTAGAAALGGLAVLLLDRSLYGAWLGGYGLLNARDGGFSAAGLALGLAGVLVSPSRGLLLFAPWTVLAPAGFARARRPFTRRLVGGALVAAGLGVLAAASYQKWWGGYSLGPRILVEASLALAIATLPLWTRRRSRAGRVLLAATVLAGTLIQLALLHGFRARDWNAIADIDRHPERLWSWRYGQLAAALVPGWRFAAPPYETVQPQPPALRRGGRQVLVPVDLTPRANARFDLDPFHPESRNPFPRYAQLDPERLNGAGPLFRFLPRGEPNCWSVRAPGVESLELAAPVRASELYVLLSAGGELARGDERAIGRLAVRFAGGHRETFPLVPGRDLWAWDPDQRALWPPPSRIFAGLPFEPEVLAWQRFRLAWRPERVSALELHVDAPGTTIVVLAATFARPAGGRSRR